MARKSKISDLKKIDAIEKYLRGEDSLNHLAEVLNVSWTSIKQWLQVYLSLGPSGLLHTSKNSVYTKEFRIIAVQDYLTNNNSQMDICKKYSIKSTSQLRDWILKYNSCKYLLHIPLQAIPSYFYSNL